VSTVDLASQSGLLKFAVTLLKDYLFKSLKLVGRGDVTEAGGHPLSKGLAAWP
jgi:hypothetical protein